MTDSWRKLLASTVICYAVGFLALLFVSISTFSLQRALSLFYWDWVFARTWSEFIRLLPVSQGWAVLLTYAWAIPMTRPETGPASITLFTGSIVLTLVLGLAFAVVYLVWHPAAVSRVRDIEYTSALAESLRTSAEQAEREQDFQNAEVLLTQYLGLVGDDPDGQQRLREVRNQIDLARRTGSVAEEPFRGVPSDATVASLIDRAVAARSREDYSTAHYMALLALSLDEENATASRIAAESLNRLATVAPNQQEGAELQLFRNKQRAKTLLTQNEAIEAYYLLASLAESYPFDSDVGRYLQIAQERLQDQAFFRDEVEQALTLPGVFDVVFVNERDADRTELVSIGKLVRTRSGIYAQQVAVFEFTDAGRPTYALQSDYAKLIDGHFVFTVVDRGAQMRIMNPTVTVGAATRPNPGLLQLSPVPSDLSMIADLSGDPDTASIGSLLRGSEILDAYGILPTPLQTELVVRLVTPVTFVLLALFCMSFGWRFRSKHLHLPPLPTLLVVPVAPLLLMAFYEFIVYVQRVLYAAALLATSFTVSFVMFVGVQAILLSLVLFYAALAARR